MLRALTATLVLQAIPGLAASLGDIQVSSHLGQTLQARIPVRAEADEGINAECIRLEGPRSDAQGDLPWLRSAQIEWHGSGAQPFISLRSLQPVTAPVLMLALRLDCGASLRREYTLLLDPPAQPSPNLASPSSTTPAGDGLRVAPGESLADIARSLFPDNRSLQGDYIARLRQANPGRLDGISDDSPLTAGLALSAPPIRSEPVAPGTPKAVRPPPPVRPAVPPRPTSDTPPPPRRTRQAPRLVLGQDVGMQMATSIAGRRELSEAERERLRTELQLIATLDQKIATQLELSDKLRQLEALQDRLQSDVAALELRLQSQQQQLPASAASPPPPLVEPRPAAPPPAPGTPALPLWLISLLAAALPALLLVWWLRRRKPAEPAELAPVTSGSGDTTEPGPSDDLFEPLSEDDIWPDRPQTPPRRTATAELPDLGSASELGPASVLHIEDEGEEHDSAVELAEIMMSFGRVQGAAQTLADYIRANPKQAVKPWVKLLEVYKAANMRTEFDALCSQLNKTFNVKPVSWDEFDVALRAPESLENIPHLRDRLCRSWGKRECQAWLHELLRDNRQGTRQGFPLAMVDEILLLLAILESQLGPYRPDAEPPEEMPAPEQATATVSMAFALDTKTNLPGIGQTGDIPPMAPQISTTDLDLGFEDTTGLTRTLHINLDDLPDESTQTTVQPRPKNEA